VFAFACKNMVEKGRLRHSWRGGKLHHTAVLDDYAHMMRASLSLLEATGNNIYLDQAEVWMATVQAYYADEKGGGYFLSADDANDLIIRSKTIADNAVSSGTGVMAECLARLYLLTGKEEYHERANKLICTFSGSQAQNLISQLGLMMGFEILERALSIVIIGDYKELVRAAIEVAPPWRVILRIPPGATLAGKQPACGKTNVNIPAVLFVWQARAACP
jgi:uncharacterized protein YyaL (SSP411 family)